jgi:ParB-like chromosome segregation protein Spo0J
MIEKIQRSQIQAAAYNPRKISDEHRANLETSMREFGLVVPLVWNKQTGNLVSGHQRLAILDKENPTDFYELEVSVVDLPLEREQALNMILNSAEVSGEFDKDDALRKLLDGLTDKFDFDLSALVIGEEKKSRSKLKKLTVQKPPKMAWALVGIEVNRIEEIQGQLDLIAANPDTIVETTFN